VPIIGEDGVLDFFFFKLLGCMSYNVLDYHQSKGPWRPLYPTYYFVYIFVICPYTAASRPAFSICASNRDQYQILYWQTDVSLG